MTGNRRTSRLVAVTIALAGLTGCSDSSSDAPDTVAPTEAPTIATTSTVPAPTTLPASAVFLRSDGIGSFTFGAPYEGFEEGIALEEDSNDGGRFPVDLGTGLFASENGEATFAYPRARLVCWNDGLDGLNGYLCAHFGGPDADTLTFVGWDYTSGTDVGTLFSSFGVTANALASDVPAIPVPEAGECLSLARVVVDGIFVDLVSDSGGAFGETPQPADARVSRMSAGETFALVAADC